MVSEQVVYADGDYVILLNHALFGSGFNVYKSTQPGGNTFEKVNERFGWFNTFDAAKSFMESVRDN